MIIDPCNENEVRLNGRVVQVCHNSEWGLVCVNDSNGWGEREAKVLCRQIELPSICEFQYRFVMHFIVVGILFMQHLKLLLFTQPFMMHLSY